MTGSGIYNPHDKVFKASMGNIQVARSMVENYLPVAIQKHLNLETLNICNGSYIDKEMEQTHSDILYSVECTNGASGYIYLLWEHQSSYDKHMALRLLSYSCRIMEQHIKQGHDKLPLVIPTLVYNGKTSPYPGSTNILDAFEDQKLARQFLFKPFSLLDLTVLDDEELVRDIWTACPNMILKHIRDEDFSPIALKLIGPMSKLSAQGGEILLEIVVESIVRYTNISDGDQLLEITKQASKEIGEKMASAAQAWLEQGEQRGIEKGMSLGRQEGMNLGEQRGIEKGMNLGEQRGRDAALKEMVIKLVNKNVDLDTISSTTGMSPAQVQELAAETVDG